MAPSTLLAIDLGAESGRLLLGHFDGERITFDEIHRFPNTPVRLIDALHWDVLRIFGEIRTGLAKAAQQTSGQLDSIGIASWAVDYGLLDKDGRLISNPYHYRDARTEGMLEQARQRVPEAEIYGTTGIQFMPINTLYQLLAMEGSPQLGIADTLLMIPDLLAYWLTGQKRGEFTNATTTQLFDLRRGDWAWDLIERLHIPRHIFPEFVAPGTQLGTLLPNLAVDVGLTADTVVTAVASHDTASAVVAVPAAEHHFAYISSGTWSLVGLELPAPVITDEALRDNFTNEGGFGGTVRFLKNVMGLWLLQECRRTWERQGRTYSYDELIQAAAAAPAFGPLVDPDYAAFLPPGDMPARIQSFCRTTGQTPPEQPGYVVRCILESLALKYRWVLERAEALSGQRAEVIHVVGGGSQNHILCQFTADATRRPVLAGPTEATAIGNLLVQAHAHAQVGSLIDIRTVVRRSTDLREYTPQGDAGEWDTAFERLTQLMATAPR